MPHPRIHPGILVMGGEGLLNQMQDKLFFLFFAPMTCTCGGHGASSLAFHHTFEEVDTLIDVMRRPR